MSLFQTQPFYHQTIKRLVMAFGDFFTGIQIHRLTSDKKRDSVIEVPIEFGPKNKWLERIRSEPEFNVQKVEMTLPRLAFEIIDYTYDANRKVGPKGFYTLGTVGANRAKLFNPIPYDVGINLHSICKTQEESLQILEQIIPYFSPSITLSIVLLDQFNLTKDVPIVLRNVTVTDTYEGSPEQFRTVVQTFSFIAQLDLFGPVVSSNKVIKVAKADVSGTIPDENDPLYLTKNDNNRYTASVEPRTATKEETHTIEEKWFGEGV